MTGLDISYYAEDQPGKRFSPLLEAPLLNRKTPGPTQGPGVDLFYRQIPSAMNMASPKEKKR